MFRKLWNYVVSIFGKKEEPKSEPKKIKDRGVQDMEWARGRDRICRKCKIKMSLLDFYWRRHNLYYRECKTCLKFRNKKTLEGRDSRLGRIWLSQKSNSKQRNHPQPGYTREWFYKFAVDNGYDELFKAWVDSGYDEMLVPSCDRINNDMPYMKENIQFMTRAENKEKGGYLPCNFE